MGAFLSADDINNSILKDFEACFLKKGLHLTIPDIDVPGIGNILFVVIETLEKGIETALGPLGKALKLAMKIKDALTDPTALIELLKEVAELVAGLIEIVKNLIGFVIKQLLEPLQKLAIPIIISIPGIPPIEILPNFPTEEIKKRIQDTIDAGSKFLEKVVQIILFPIQFTIKLLTSILDMVMDFLSDVVGKVVEFIQKLTNPLKLITDMIAEFLATVIEQLGKTIAGVIEDADAFKNAIVEYVKDLLSFKPIDIKKYLDLSIDFSKILPFLALIGCVVSFILFLLPIVIKALIA